MGIEGINHKLFKQKSEQELSSDEINDVIHIVDIGPKHLDKITPDNIERIIAEGEKELIEPRKQINKFPPDQLPSEVLETLSERSSMSHAIQCSVNGAEDFKAFQEHLNQYLDSKPKDEFVESFLRRHIKMSEELTELYKIDIAGRIGLAKNEKLFFGQEKPDFIELTKELKKSVEEFEAANKEKLAKLPELQKTTTDLKDRLNKEDYENLNKTFYSEICQKYSELIFNDFEALNEKELKDAVRSMEE